MLKDLGGWEEKGTTKEKRIIVTSASMPQQIERVGACVSRVARNVTFVWTQKVSDYMFCFLAKSWVILLKTAKIVPKP